jgi:hypothetical protein
VSRPLVLSVRGFANTASALIYLVAPNLAGMWLGKSLDDLGKAAFRPAWGSLMADISSQDRRKRARIMGYLTAGEDAGDIAAPILAGLLWTGFGVPAVLLARVGLAVMAEAYTLWLEHRAPASGHRGGRHRLGAAPVPVDRYPVEVRGRRGHAAHARMRTVESGERSGGLHERDRAGDDRCRVVREPDRPAIGVGQPEAVAHLPPRGRQVAVAFGPDPKRGGRASAERREVSTERGESLGPRVDQDGGDVGVVRGQPVGEDAHSAG